MTVDRASALPLWAQVLGDLRRRLASGEFGERVPGDDELTAQYGVSRHTVREAVRRLQAEGVVERGRGRGTFVKDRVIEQPLGHPEWWYITLFRAPLEHADGPADACGLPTALTGPASPRGRQP